MMQPKGQPGSSPRRGKNVVFVERYAKDGSGIGGVFVADRQRIDALLGFEVPGVVSIGKRLIETDRRIRLQLGRQMSAQDACQAQMFL